jgi:YVTN family beta-propeller protein/autotransporter-associated beta strand protein
MLTLVVSRIFPAVALLLITSTAALAQVTSYAFVPNRFADTVTMIDTAAQAVVATVPVGDYPTATAISPDGRRVYVANRGDDTVSVIDTVTRTVVGVPIAVGDAPVAIAITPDGAKAYVANYDSRTVSVIDLATNAVTAIPGLPLPSHLPVDIAIAPDGGKAYVVMGDPGVLPIDVATDTIGTVIPTGGTTTGIALHGQTAWVVQATPDEVAIVDLSSSSVIDNVSLFTLPGEVAISPDGAHAYVVNPLTNNVTVIDTASRNIVTTQPTGIVPAGVAFASDGSQAYIINAFSDNVTVMNAAAHTLETTISVGDGPWGSGDYFISPNIIVGNQTTIASDADFDARHFRSFVPFIGGTVQATADWTTTRTLSLLGNGGAIDTNGSNVTIDGDVINDGTLFKVGAGTLTLNGTSTHAGGTYVQTDGGTLIVNGTHSGLVLLGNGATLRGTGTIGAIQTVVSTISPGGVAPGVTTGILHATNVDLFPQSTVALEIKGSAPGTGYDRLDVSGTAILDNAFLVLDASGFSPTPAQQFTVVTNATGHFRYPEGSMVPGGGGNRFRITYAGGDGNDVVLTADVESPQMAGIHALTIDEDAGLVSLPFTVSDDVFLGSEIVTAINSSSNAALLPLANISIVGAGSARTVQLTALPNASGTSLVGIHAADGAGRSQSRSFLVTVNPVNDPPTISAIGAQSVPENTPLDPIAFTVGDIDNDVDTLTVTATSSNQSVVPDANLVIGGSGANRTIAATPLVGVRGDTTITLTVSDGTDTATTSFTLSVVERTYYLAEGATGAFFDTDILLANPNSVATPVVIRFLTGDGASIVETRTLPPTSRTTIHAEDVEGLEATTFSTIVTSTNALPIVVERTMRWDASGYGAHTEKATAGAAPVWYFAEGSQGFFSTFFLLANPQAAPNTAHVTWFREGEPALTRDYELIPGSRKTIDAGDDAELVNRSFGARVTFDLPGVAERAMYFGRDPQWVGGHAAAGTTVPATSWFLAEGATGSYFTTFLLLANPNDKPADVTLTYFPASGEPVTKTDTIAAHQRMTRNIATEDPTLASAAVATRIASTLPIIAERSQYWGTPTWIEAHNSAGVTSAHTRWGLAEGRVGGADDAQTYILLANANTDADATATVTLTFLRADGTTIVKPFVVPPASRFNVSVTPGAGSMAPELINESFGVLIESTQPIVVERSVYSNANGVTWAAGTNATATRLP